MSSGNRQLDIAAASDLFAPGLLVMKTFTNCPYPETTFTVSSLQLHIISFIIKFQHLTKEYRFSHIHNHRYYGFCPYHSVKLLLVQQVINTSMLKAALSHKPVGVS